MAHEIDMSNGRANAAFARTPAWHGLGKVLPGTMSSNEAIEHAGLNWRVDMRAMFRHDNNGQMVNVSDKRAVVRCDTDKLLGVVGTQFVPVQNNELAGFLDAVVGLGARIESAGALHGGRKIWFLCSLKESFDVAPNDEIKPYALFMNGHDGNTRFRCVPTTVRVVCANTLSIATENETLGMTVRHDGQLAANIGRAREALGLVYSRTESMKREAQALVATRMRAQQLGEYFVRQVEGLRFTKDRAEEVLRELAQLVESPTNSATAIRGTAWSAFNAWSEWVDHAPRRTGADVRLESNWIGEGHKQKHRAWQDALSLAS